MLAFCRSLSKHYDASLEVIESNPTTGLIGGKVPVSEASLVQVSSLLFEGNDHDIGPESTPHDASKSLHVVEEEMQVAPPEIELLYKEITTAEGIFFFPTNASSYRKHRRYLE